MKLTTRYLLYAATITGLATLVSAWIIFSYFYQREREAFLDRLDSQVSVATMEHGDIFEHARSTHVLAVRLFQERLAVWQQFAGDAAGADAFDTFFADHGDGTFRSRDELFDGRLTAGGRWIFGMGAFIAPGLDADPERKVQLLAAFDVVATLGQGILSWTDNFYYYTPDNDIVIFGPNRHDRLEFYRKNAPGDFDFQDREIARHIRPENNPDRLMRCTGLENLLYDTTNRRYASGCQLPVDPNGEFAGAFGVSFMLDGWLADVISQPIEGEHPFVIDASGEMIAHQDLVDLARAEGPAIEFSARINADVLVTDILATNRSSGSIYFAPWDAYVTFARFEGPEWFFIATVARS